MFSLQSIFSDKIGLGRYQLKIILVLVLLDLNDGAELVAMSFMMPIIKKQFDLQGIITSLMVSVFYLGACFGACFSGRIADVYGRKPAIIWSSIFYVTVANLMAWSTSIEELIIYRFLYGTCYGFTLPLTTSIFSEIIPIEIRGKGMVCVNFFVTIGKIYGFLVAYLTLDSYSSGNWRKMIILNTIPGILVFIGTLIWVEESARFHFARGDVDRGIDTIERMIKENKQQKAVQLTDVQKTEIRSWQQKFFSSKETGRFLDLFKPGMASITLKVWGTWIILNALYFGQLNIMPFIYGKQKSGFGSYFITIVGEVPSILVSLCIVDVQGLGRQNSLVICFFGATIFNLICYVGQYSILPSMSSTARFFMKECFAMLYPFTAELYNTNIRTLGFGWASGIGRLGAAFIPYIILPLAEHNYKNPFLVFFILSAFAFIITYSLPYDTLGKKLDENESQIELKQINEVKEGLLKGQQ